MNISFLCFQMQRCHVHRPLRLECDRFREVRSCWREPTVAVDFSILDAHQSRAVIGKVQLPSWIHLNFNISWNIHFILMLRYVEALNPGDYHEEIYNQVLNQLNAVALVLETIELHAGTNWYNTLVTPNAYISTVLLTILKHFSKKTSAIQLRKKSNKFQWLCCGAFIVFFVAAKKIL